MTWLEFESNARQTSGRAENTYKVQHVPANCTISNRLYGLFKLSAALVISCLFFPIFLPATAKSQRLY